jgi:hypothetical protein
MAAIRIKNALKVRKTTSLADIQTAVYHSAIAENAL